MSKLDAKVFSSITPFSKQWIDLTPRYNVDLGSLDWSKVNHTTYGTYYAAAIIALGIPVLSIDYPNFIYPIYCSKYSATNRKGLATEDKVMCCDGSISTVSQLQIKDSDFTGTAAEFKQYIAGTDLVYAKTKEFNMYEFLNEYQDFLANDYGIVDLGSFNWYTAGTAGTEKRMQADELQNIIMKPSSAGTLADIKCLKYEVRTANGTYSKQVGVSVDTAGKVIIYDENYNTNESVSAFKAAMSGVYLVFKLADNIGRVNLSGLTFSWYTENNCWYIASPWRAQARNNGWCENYSLTNSWLNMPNNSMYLRDDASYIYIKTNGTNQIKPSGYLYYEKAQ